MDKKIVQTMIMLSSVRNMYAVISLIANGDGLFENKYSPKKISSSGNNSIKAKTFGLSE